MENWSIKGATGKKLTAGGKTGGICDTNGPGAGSCIDGGGHMLFGAPGLSDKESDEDNVKREGFRTCIVLAHKEWVGWYGSGKKMEKGEILIIS